MANPRPALGRVDRMRARAFRRAMAVSPRTARRLAGRPLRVEGATLSPHTQWMLRLQRIARERGAETMPVPQGRLAMRRQAMLATGHQPVGEVRETTVAGAEGPLPARLYVPTGGAEALLVFLHGGGMVYGDLDSHDGVCRFLAEQAQVRVLAVDYRLAPEHPFPAAVEDAAAAYRDVVEHAERYGADPRRLAVGGDSAGAYLSATTAIRAAEERLPLRLQLLVYPVTDMEGTFPSRATFGHGLYLTSAFLQRATELYLQGHDPRDPRASVIHAELPQGLAPAFVATAGFDPLRDEGEAYAARLERAGVEVRARRYAGEIHGFANLLCFEGPARTAMVEAAAALRDALA
jgi:acetyl esterase